MDADAYRSWLSAIAVVLTLTAFFPYILSIRGGQTRPHVFSWVIWSMNTSVAFLAANQAGGGIGTWVIGFSAGVTLFIAVLAYINRADVTVTLTDRLFFAAALAAMPLWYWLNDPLWAIWLVTIIELLGFGPTLRKAWFQPYSESFAFLGMLVVRNALIISALERYTTTTVLFSAAMAAACLALIAVMAYRRPMVTTSDARIRS
ncbi:hypothetical protein B1C78_14500 [Thioalkalivibrio denitrificans]|uniref:Uncharacterized protein n=1 Tax=Thioalkalivibrio denitrificans TaxID=108003 RepID=A0A1V3NCQ6_9GAMM|nr:hypothetical protein [Thioalkalivibrio denitrificans]OOG22642.1 hypothetical protein B1C78_14500 [Thioalkalivibrio denitrificans]